MKRREFITLVGGAAAWPLAARAQQPGRIWRIGILHGLPPEVSIGFAAFRERLGQLGYVVDGQNVILDYRWADQMDRLASLAAALAEMKVDVIVTSDGTRAKAAKQATREIPIVVAVFTDDPVASGLIESLRHPGGNITGLALFAPEMSEKRLEILRDIMPRLSRVGILWTRQSVTNPALLRAANQAAHQLGIHAVEIELADPNDLEHAFDPKERVDAVMALQGIEFYRIRARIAELGLKHRVPIIAGEDGFARFGGLVQYGPSTTENWRQAADYVNKILKGGNPADLPVLQPTKIELIINLKTAQALEITVPPMLLARADEVIE